MVWILTIFLYWAPPNIAVVQVEVTSPGQCAGAAKAVAENAAREGALGIEVMGCQFVAQDA
jgi:hypothetical protein